MAARGKREARRYDYILYPTPADRRKRTNGQRIVVGAEYYVRGTMLRYVYFAEAPEVWPLHIWHPEESHEVDIAGMPCLGYIYASYLREYGR